MDYSNTQVLKITIFCKEWNTKRVILFLRLQQGMKIVSQIDNAKFRPLVNRICQNLHLSTAEKAFSSEEVEKLLVSLNLKRDELDLLHDSITLIYSQAAFSVVKPAIMESIMKETFQVSEDKISIFVNAWITYAKGIIDALRNKSIFPRQVFERCFTPIISSFQ